MNPYRDVWPYLKLVNTRGVGVKKVPEGELKYGRIKSEGKIVEVTPFLETMSGQPYMLPPVLYRVENWLLGYEDYDVVARPQTYMPQFQSMLNGNRNDAVRLSFMVRVLEDGSEGPEEVRGMIDPESVKAIVDAFREMNSH